jgi:hypothetical protein
MMIITRIKNAMFLEKRGQMKKNKKERSERNRGRQSHEL